MHSQIVTLWIGADLSPVERLCLASFVQNNHPVALYHYATVNGVPRGVELRDAEAVLPLARVQAALGADAPPNLVANWFRLELMKRGAGIWVDTDVVCIRPIDLDASFIAGWESDRFVNNAVLRLAPDGPILRDLLSYFENGGLPPWVPLNRAPELYLRKWLRRPIAATELPRATLGPKGLTALLHKYGGEPQPREAFYPLHPRSAMELLTPAKLAAVVTAETLAMHLWNEKIGRLSTIPPGTMLAELAGMYLPRDNLVAV